MAIVEHGGAGIGRGDAAPARGRAGRASGRRSARRSGLPGDGLAALLSSTMALRGPPRSRSGVVDLREYRAACIAAYGLRAALDGASWLARVRIGYAGGGGLEVRAEACREPRGAEKWLVPAFLHGVPVRVVRAG